MRGEYGSVSIVVVVAIVLVLVVRDHVIIPLVRPISVQFDLHATTADIRLVFRRQDGARRPAAVVHPIVRLGFRREIDVVVAVVDVVVLGRRGRRRGRRQTVVRSRALGRGRLAVRTGVLVVGYDVVVALIRPV